MSPRSDCAPSTTPLVEVAEYSHSGTLLRRYIHGPGTDDPILWFEGSSTAASNRRFLHADERGSIVSITDNAGGTVNINSYDDWGIPAWDPQHGDLNIGRFQYTGQIWLEEIGLYYYKARFYSPTLGRFMQTDPIGYEDGMNMYAYVGNDPVNGTDPSGRTTRPNSTPGRRVVILTPSRAQHIRDRHGPATNRNPGVDHFRRSYSDTQLQQKAGFVVSAATDHGQVVQEGNRTVFEAETGNFLTNLFAPEGTEGQSTVRVITQDLLTLSDPRLIAEATNQLEELAPEIGLASGTDGQGAEPVEVHVVITMYPVKEENLRIPRER